MHIFGSDPKGPYLKEDQRFVELFNLTEHPYHRSPARIRHSIDLYFHRIGIPDRVFLHTSQWDMNRVYESQGLRYNHPSARGDLCVRNSAEWNSTVSVFVRNLDDRITDVMDQLQINLKQRFGNQQPLPTVDIVLRSAVVNEAAGVLLSEFNYQSSLLAARRNVSFMDSDSDLRSSLGWNEDGAQNRLFRDFIHPREYFTKRLAFRYLELTYSSYFTIRHPPPKAPQIWLGIGPRPLRVKSVSLVSANAANDTFLLSYDDKTARFVRHSPILPGIRIHMFLGTADILAVTGDVLAHISEGPKPDLPSCLFDNPIHPCAVNTSIGKLFVDDGFFLTEVTSPMVLPFLNISTIVNLQSYNLPLLRNMLRGETLRYEVFHNMSLVSAVGDRRIYLLIDNKRRMIASGDVFMSNGWLWSDVHHIPAHTLNRIPLGDPVSKRLFR